jgi:glycosyltransferase involved in cell wall biosynthesis
MMIDLNQRTVVFIIPNHKLEGAQNFFRRIFSQIQANKKFLIVEEDSTFLKNLLLISSLEKAKNLTLFTTVNSNKLGLLFKISHPSSRLVMRLGNTISLEISKRSLKYFYHRLFYLVSIFFCQKFIFQSNVMKKDFIDFFKFKDSSKFIVIHNGVNSPDFNQKPEFLLPNNKKVNFLLVGSFKRQKGYDIFLSSIKSLDQAIKDRAHFHICGDGAEFQEFKKNVLQFKLDSMISVYGHISPHTLYLQSDVYILPSRFEGFSNSLIEALSYGLPAIVSDCPSANREVITQGFNGVFFKNLSSADLLKNILYMLENYQEFNKNNIQLDTYERFSLGSICKVYQNLI